MNPREFLMKVNPATNIVDTVNSITGGQSNKFVMRTLAGIADGLLSFVGLDRAIQGIAEDNNWSPSEDDLDKLRSEYNKLRDELQKMSPPELADLRSLVGKNPGGSSYWNEVNNNERIGSENNKRTAGYNTAVSSKEAEMNKIQDRYDETAKRVGEWAEPATKILKDTGVI